MNKTTLLIALTTCLLVHSNLNGEDQTNSSSSSSKIETKVSTQSVIVKDGESLEEAIERSMKEISKDGEVTSNVSGTIVIRGADGKEERIELDESTKGGSVSRTVIVDGNGTKIETFDSKGIGDAINEALAEAMKQAQQQISKGQLDSNVSVSSSSTILIGPDGKPRSLKEGETLSDAINKMIKDAIPGESGISGIGPAMITGPNDLSKIQSQLDEMKKELAKQRKLLESINKKLK